MTKKEYLSGQCKNGHILTESNTWFGIEQGVMKYRCRFCSALNAEKHRRARGVTAKGTISIVDWFWSNVEKTETCWLWKGTTQPNGYGSINKYGIRKMAHIFSYELLGKIVPEGLDLDHLCFVRNCINPDHLEPVTRRVNMLRAM